MANWILGILAVIAGALGAVVFGKSRKIRKLEDQNSKLAYEKADMEAERNRELQKANAAKAGSELNASIAKVALKVGDDAEPAFGNGQALSEEDRKIAEDIMSNHR